MSTSIPDGEHLTPMRRQADLVERAGEAHEGAVNGAMLAHAQLDAVALRRQLDTDSPKMAAQVIARRFALQCEVEVLGVPRQAEKEPQAGATVEGQRRHRSGALQRTENPRLQVFAYDVTPPHRLVSGNELPEMVLHSDS